VPELTPSIKPLRAPHPTGFAASYDLPQMSEAEVTFIEKTIAKFRDRIANDRAEIDIIRAQVAKLLLPKQPNLDQIKEQVKKSLEFEGDIRVAEIERQIDLRNQFGDDRWTSLWQRVRALKIELKDVDGAALNGNWRRWFHIVRAL
jgi:hypothetical protein